MCIGQNKREFETTLQQDINRALKLKYFYTQDSYELEEEEMYANITHKMGSQAAQKFATILTHKIPPLKEIPEHLVCTISSELFTDPVTLSSGFTYDRPSILSHFNFNGYIDPITSKPISQDFIV